MNWSGGKDSAFCLYRVLQSQIYKVTHLLTNVNAVHDRISMHGVRRSLLQAQAGSMGIPVDTVELPEQSSMTEYEALMMDKVKVLKDSGCTHSIFGDIFLEDLRNYREEKLSAAGVSCVFPLWNMDTTDLARQFIKERFKSIIVCVNDKYLDSSFCGRLIDESLLNDLPDNVDPCGENGEFHSFVFDGPIFKHRVSFTKGDIVYRKYTAPKVQDGDCHTTVTHQEHGFYFCDLLNTV